MWICIYVAELEWIYNVRISYDCSCVRIVGDHDDVLECVAAIDRI